jgi:hypothetical protein
MIKKLEALILLVPALLLVAVGGMIEEWVRPRPAHAASQFANIICDNFTPVSAISANTRVVLAGNANMFVYVCSYNLNASAALTFSIVEGTGATCGTGTAAMVGGATAANGLSLGIAGTVNYGGGAGAVTKTVVSGDSVCIFPSAGNLSGVVGWTQMAF